MNNHFKSHFGKQFTLGKLDVLSCLQETIDKNTCFLEQRDCRQQEALLRHCLSSEFDYNQDKILTQGLLFDSAISNYSLKNGQDIYHI